MDEEENKRKDIKRAKGSQSKRKIVMRPRNKKRWKITKQDKTKQNRRHGVKSRNYMFATKQDSKRSTIS